MNDYEYFGKGVGHNIPHLSQDNDPLARAVDKFHRDHIDDYPEIYYD